MSFAALGLPDALVAACAGAGFLAPTPIQQQAIPAIAAGADLCARADTGSGKTAAFCLPLLARWSSAPKTPRRRLQALIVVPTRELAQQVGATLRQLALSLPRPPRLCTLYGGVSLNPQMLALRGGADFIVATPGRLLDLHARNALELGGTATLVLDEADRLLALGFADALADIVRLLPAQRQTLLFSATLTPTTRQLAAALLRQPQQIDVSDTPSAAPPITQRAFVVDAQQRTRLLRQLLDEEGWPQLLVFVASQHGAEQLAAALARTGLSAAAFHGASRQGTRNRTLAEFKSGALQVLVATDLAARGIDISALPAVVNYDLPRAAADYTHRIGRTGRAGCAGVAVSFVTREAEAHFRLIEKQQGLRVAREQRSGFASAAPVARADGTGGTGGTGGIKGKRKSKKDKLREAAQQANPGKSDTP